MARGQIESEWISKKTIKDKSPIFTGHSYRQNKSGFVTWDRYIKKYLIIGLLKYEKKMIWDGMTPLCVRILATSSRPFPSWMSWVDWNLGEFEHQVIALGSLWCSSSHLWADFAVCWYALPSLQRPLSLKSLTAIWVWAWFATIFQWVWIWQSGIWHIYMHPGAQGFHCRTLHWNETVNFIHCTCQWL